MALHTITELTAKMNDTFLRASSVAPSEVSPAESAHTLGSQITFGGKVYNVTTAIAIGDDIVISPAAGYNVVLADDLNTDLGQIKQALSDLSKEVPNNDAYAFRQGKGNMVDLDIVGGSLAWNQLVQNGNFVNTDEWSAARATMSVSNNELTVTGTDDNGFAEQIMPFIPGHKYLISVDAKGSVSGDTNPIVIVYYGTWNDEWHASAQSTSFKNYASVINAVTGDINHLRLRAYNANFTNTFKNVQTFDLTQMLGTTIADYIYSLEQANAGDGVAWFRKYFPNAYYAYVADSIESVNVASRNVVGFNQWDEIFESGAYDTSTGGKIANSLVKRSANFVRVLPNTDYYVKTNLSAIRVFFYDANKNYINNSVISTNFTTDANVYYITFQCDLSVQYICINISKTTGSPKNGDYEPYKEISYDFDSSKTLHGIPQLVDGELQFDGDIYKADGSITRKYGIVNLKDCSWSTLDASAGKFYTSTVGTPIKSAICSRYVGEYKASESGMTTDKTMYYGHTSDGIVIYDSTYAGYTASQFKSAMDGIYVVYELATLTTESAEPFQNPQRAFSDGTEEFIDAGVEATTRDVAIPVGNNSVYAIGETLPESEDYTDGANKALLDTIKAVVADSSDFADFQTKMAAL